MTRLAMRCATMLRRHGVLRRGASFMVAASGGLDSTVLCHLMRALAERWDLRLHFAYVHHGLRKDANAEALFVEQLALALNAEFHLSHVDVRGEQARGASSLQDVARRLRYAALEDIRAAAGATAVLTAHHADDQAETVLAHFLRGSGVRGLTGIKPRLGTVLRPLLDIPREDLLAFAREHGIEWMEDASNAGDAYTRNAIRHHVLPAIESYVTPGIRSVLCDTSTLFSSLDEFLAAHTAQLMRQTVCESGTESVSLAVPAMKGYFEFERMLIFRSAVALVRGDEASFDEVATLLTLLNAPIGKRSLLQGGLEALRERDALVLHYPLPSMETISVRPGESCPYADAVFSSVEHPVAPAMHASRDREVIDLDRAGAVWRLRAWNDADVFQPLGGEGRKRVRDFLADQGFSSRRRSRIPVLEGDCGIIWVCGVRLDQRAALTEQSERVAAIFYQRSEEQ